MTYENIAINAERFESPPVPLDTPPEQLPPVPLDTLREQLPPNFLTMKVQDYIVGFSGNTVSYCVGIVDMVNSTKITSQLSLKKSAKYYEIFLNTMARVLNRFGGMIVKNVGDSLLFYFPESSKGRSYGFMTGLEGSLAMQDAHNFINMCAKKEGLPGIDYRISCDYGPVMIMDQNESHGVDMIGPSLNMCSKINHFATKNEFVIGGDLYQVTKKLPDYSFSSKGKCDLQSKYSYPVYSVCRK
ncbi:MAG TPA: adenylate/guanylate cyclase domain-containing protein [Nitrosopumilaceae archaeon]|nr:adenylate/guanylate cyclase domain-containing protein [Nitrosopumilaceae archaeon]